VAGKVALEQQGISKTQLVLTGKVLAITNGAFRVTGPIYTGSMINMGRSVLFDIGTAQIVVTEQRVEPYDLGVFTSLGIAPAKRVFEPIAKGLVECDSDTGGPTSSNYALFPIRKIRRPIYPLDLEMRW
jgi:microcystin degradation protein MlrC